MTEPKVTVLMTVKNGEPYLKEAVASILNQTYRDFRFLIIDNASTDSSREVIRSFEDARVELIELSEDIGQTAALNRGLEMVSTPWVARMDADDVSLPRRLELQMEYLEHHSDVVLLGTAVIWIDGKDKVLKNSCPAGTDTDIRWGLLLGSDGVAHSSAMFSTKAVSEIGGYPAEYILAQDFALWSQLVGKGHVANLKTSLVKIRIHGANTTRPELMEQEVRTVMSEGLHRLLPDVDSDFLEDVLCALRYDPDSINQSISGLLQELPKKFEDVENARLSKLSRRAYVNRWLHMAVLANVRGAVPLSWLRLAMAIDPIVIMRPAMWRTIAVLALQFVRGRGKQSSTSGLEESLGGQGRNEKTSR